MKVSVRVTRTPSTMPMNVRLFASPGARARSPPSKDQDPTLQEAWPLTVTPIGEVSAASGETRLTRGESD